MAKAKQPDFITHLVPRKKVEAEHEIFLQINPNYGSDKTPYACTMRAPEAMELVVRLIGLINVLAGAKPAKKATRKASK